MCKFDIQISKVILLEALCDFPAVTTFPRLSLVCIRIELVEVVDGMTIAFVRLACGGAHMVPF